MSSYIGLVPDSPQLLVYRYYATATQGQTSVTVRAYTAGQTDVWVNGVKLVEGDDFSATDGTTINFTVALNLDDIVEIKTYEAASVANRQTMVTYEFVASSAGQTFTGLDYTPGLVMVSRNGFSLPSGDYTAGDGATLTVSSAAIGDDIILHGFSTFEVANALTQAVADGRYVSSTTPTLTTPLLVSQGAQGQRSSADVLVTGGISDGNYDAINWWHNSVGGSEHLGQLRVAYNSSGKTDLEWWGRGQLDGTLGTDPIIRADQFGRVTMPYQPSFRAMGGITSFSGTGQYLAANTIQHNIGNHYNGTTGVFTAPVSGMYHFDGQITMLSAASQGMTCWWLNGSRFGCLLSYAGASNGAQSISVYLNVNDTFAFGGAGANGGSWTSWSSSHQFFSGYLVG